MTMFDPYNQYRTDGVIREAERVLKLLEDDVIRIREDCRTKEVRRGVSKDEKGKERDQGVQSYADWVANARSRFKLRHNDPDPQNLPYTWGVAVDLIKAYDYGQTWGYLETGEGFVLRISELEGLSKKLSQDLDAIKKERDDWKKRYDDCERAKFGTSGLVGDVSESP